MPSVTYEEGRAAWRFTLRFEGRDRGNGTAASRSLYTGDYWLLASYWVKLVTWLHLLPLGIKAAAVVWPGRFKLDAEESTLNKSAIHLFTIGLVLI